MKQLTLLIFLFFSLIVQAQSPKINYPVGYFAFPIMPGQRNFLSGGFGDLRPNHFHAGIDIKTQQREGLPTYASAEGYVSRVRVMTSGYGNVIYITHPNGFQTVYGHLLRFNERIGNYVRNRQYQQQSFEVDLVPLPGELPVSKLEIIGLSGNSGGSGGPHLHYEIRDQQGNVINPFNFGFNEVLDEVAPQLRQIALVPLTPDARINGEYRRQVFPLLRKPGIDYYLEKPLVVVGEVGIELLAYDLTSGSQNLNGVTSVEVDLDNKRIWAFSLEHFPNDLSRDINLHINYEVQERTGQRFQRLYLADGNRMNFYERNPTMGRIKLTDNALHQVSFRVWDAYQNASFLNFSITGSSLTATETIKPSIGTTVVNTSIDHNTLLIKASRLKTATPVCEGFFDKKKKEIPLSYIKNNEAVFIHDLRKGLPDSLRIDNTWHITHLKTSVLPNRKRSIEEHRTAIIFDTESLYDTLHLAIREFTNGIQIGENTVPLKEAITVRFRPIGNFDKTKTFAYLHNGGRPRFVGGTWKGNEIEFKTRELGTFALLTDTEAPKARIGRRDSSQITAFISDGLSGIESFRMTVNGEWVLMNYDYKRSLLWSEKLDKNKPFDGELVLEVKDRAGNVTVLNDDFSQVAPKTPPTTQRKVVPRKKKRK